jgi:mRNA-degrading endonuclease RelE of RelBE toxin-antitoxin system
MAKKIAWINQARAEEGDVKRPTDIDPPELRLRLGDYRIRFYDHGETIQILGVGNRKDAYR